MATANHPSADGELKKTVSGHAAIDVGIQLPEPQAGVKHSRLRVVIEVRYRCPRCERWHSKAVEPEDRVLEPHQRIHYWQRRCPLVDGEFYIVRLSDRQLKRKIAEAERLIVETSIERSWLPSPLHPDDDGLHGERATDR